MHSVHKTVAAKDEGVKRSGARGFHVIKEKKPEIL